MFTLLPIFFFCIGIIVGSFVNVAVLRFGFFEKPSVRSECPHCSRRIAWYDLLPVLSYVALSGRCRFCGSRLTLQYPLVELCLGALFALSYVFYPPALAMPSLIAFFALLTFWAAFVAIVAYDMRHTLIPLSFVALLAVAAIVERVAVAFSVHSVSVLLDAVFGALFLGGFFLFIFLITQGKGMGVGDSYVAAGAGILLGLVKGIDAATLGVWLGATVSLVLMFSSQVRLFGNGPRVTMKTELPFAPWLFAGTILALFSPLSALGVAEWVARFFV